MSLMSNLSLTSKFLAKARNLAKKSSLQTYKVGAVIAKGNFIIACGHNKPFGGERHLSGYRTKHAEVDAASKARAPLHDAILYVVVLTQRRHDGLSRPCEKCRNYLRGLGLKTVIYSCRGIAKMEKL